MNDNECRRILNAFVLKKNIKYNCKIKENRFTCRLQIKRNILLHIRYVFQTNLCNLREVL